MMWQQQIPPHSNRSDACMSSYSTVEVGHKEYIHMPNPRQADIEEPDVYLLQEDRLEVPASLNLANQCPPDIIPTDILLNEVICHLNNLQNVKVK